MKANDVHSFSTTMQFFGALVYIWLVAACLNGQQMYSTSQFAPPEPTKLRSKAYGDAQGQRSLAVDERMELENGVCELFLASKVVRHESSFEMDSQRVTSKFTMTSVESPKTVSFV